MLEVVLAVTGKSIAAVDEAALADNSVKALKQYLALDLCIPRFRLRCLDNSSLLQDGDRCLTLQVVQLVVMEYLQPDAEQDRRIMVACEERDDKLLEWYLNEPAKSEFRRYKCKHAIVCSIL